MDNMKIVHIKYSWNKNEQSIGRLYSVGSDFSIVDGIQTV